jgi:hypothetical protein
MPAGAAAGNAVDASAIRFMLRGAHGAGFGHRICGFLNIARNYIRSVSFSAEEAPTMRRDILVEQRRSKRLLARAVPKHRPASAVP